MQGIVQKTEVNETDIAEGLRDRDPRVIGRLIDAYGGRLFRYLLLLTGKRHTAEDIFQETWVRVLERGHQFNGSYGFQSWLFSIARHLVIDLSRQKKPLSLEDMTLDGEIHCSPPATDASPLDILCREEQETSLLSYVHRLPQHHREVFLLRYDNEMKLGEIAQTTCVPLSTVKSRLYRAATVLHGRLSPARQNQMRARELAPTAMRVPQRQECPSTA